MAEPSPPEITFMETLRAALADGCPMGRLEETLMAAGQGRDEAAAAWLYAWSHDALRPSGAPLASRLTSARM